MAQKTNQSANGTSFHDVTFVASVNQLTEAFGEPTYQDNSGSDKVNFEWVMETAGGKVFTIYDWKEYRRLSKSEPIEWHIGSHNKITCLQALEEINRVIG